MINKISVMEKSGGKFFGLQTKKGKKINARYVGGSDNYIRVFDRNANVEVKMAKSSVDTVTFKGEVFA